MLRSSYTNKYLVVFHQAFHPRVIYDENSEVNVQLLAELVTQGELGDAKIVYESLSKKGIGKESLFFLVLPAKLCNISSIAIQLLKVSIHAHGLVFYFVELPESVKQSFLELICYYNDMEMPHEEDMEERWFTAVQQKKEVRLKSWR